MPVALLLLIAAGAGWAWWTGRLKGLTFEDGIAGAAFLLGIRFATTGRLALGLPLMAGSALWAVYRRGRRASPSMPVAEARQLLGVDETATLADIRDAHRRLIARVHPDKGGSADLAHRVNLARDTLVAEMNRRTPRAS
ncbi:DnaJ domain-containing protein [Sphingosinicella humi]|uniref:Molecular chaperone DnaJ n=1 Tax=Allosphingosinicella humi TaxID=2068657 RepID=A0A2U2J5Q7_9SPHN|nr:DnaJ domain-containing protein [Sphingosinicella humi]PWG03675.1 molecular chaperone DnaJ [Sphingosinicella humi]